MIQKDLLTQTDNLYTTEKEKKYYLQINRIKLQDYIARGLIVPDIYLGEEPERDVQSKNRNYLAFASSFIETLDETQLLLEIILTEEEKAELKKVEEIYFYEKPLPITRIKQIYIQDKKTKDELLVKISNYQIGYIPQELFVFFKKGKKLIFEQGCKYQTMEFRKEQNYQEKITKFDKMMGMFSFMKNSDLYYFKEYQIYSNYSKNYISALFALSNVLEKQGSELFSVLKENKDFFDFVYSNKSMNNEFINYIIDSAKDSEIKEIFTTLLNDPTGKRKCLERLRDKGGVYFYICLLYIHKQKDSNKKDNFKANISQDIPYEKAEYALAFLGLYYGYSSLRADEEINIEDPYIKNLIDKNRVNIKFKLDSKLDYIVIETIYNYTFYVKKGYEFQYLNYPKQQKPIKLPTDKKFKTWYEVEKKEIFDTCYIKIKKRSFEEIVDNKMSKYDEEIKFGKHYLIGFAKKYYEKIISCCKNGKPTESYCNKAELIGAIKNDEKCKKDELLEVFALDKK